MKNLNKVKINILKKLKDLKGLEKKELDKILELVNNECFDNWVITDIIVKEDYIVIYGVTNNWTFFETEIERKMI